LETTSRKKVNYQQRPRHGYDEDPDTELSPVVGADEVYTC
jgi:hypothetical protein